MHKASGCIAHEQHGGHCSRAESYHASSLRALLTSSTTAIALNRSDTFKTQHASLTLPSPGREERSFRLHRHDQEQEQKLQRACCCVRCIEHEQLSLESRTATCVECVAHEQNTACIKALGALLTSSTVAIAQEQNTACFKPLGALLTSSTVAIAQEQPLSASLLSLPQACIELALSMCSYHSRAEPQRALSACVAHEHYGSRCSRAARWPLLESGCNQSLVFIADTMGCICQHHKRVAQLHRRANSNRQAYAASQQFVNSMRQRSVHCKAAWATQKQSDSMRLW